MVYRYDRDNKIVIELLGEIMINLERYDEAMKVYSSYLERNPDDEEIANSLATLQEVFGQGWSCARSQQKWHNIEAKDFTIEKETDLKNE